MGKPYHCHSSQVCIHATCVFPSHRNSSALTKRGDAPVLLSHLRCIRTTDGKSEHRSAQFGFAEEKEAGVAGGVGLAVVGGFGGDIGLWWHQRWHCMATNWIKQSAYQIDTFSKCISIHWSLWRGNTKTLGQDSTVVGNPRAVPEKATVAAFVFCVGQLLESRLFAGAFDAEDILDLKISNQSLAFGARGQNDRVP